MHCLKLQQNVYRIFIFATEERQDYFIFEGTNQAAHLFRENETLILHMSCNTEYIIFNASIEQETFQFSWSGFEVDGKKMVLQGSHGKMGSLEFENITFLAPIIDIFDLECSVEDGQFFLTQYTVEWIVQIVRVRNAITNLSLKINLIQKFWIKGSALYIWLN